MKISDRIHRRIVEKTGDTQAKVFLYSDDLYETFIVVEWRTPAGIRDKFFETLQDFSEWLDA